MSLKDYLAKDTEDLEAEFNKPEFDIDKARASLLKIVDKVEEQFASGQTKGPKRWKINRNVVKLELPVAVEGMVKFHRRTDEFPAFLSELRKSIKDGSADTALEEANNEPVITNVRKSVRSSGGGDPVFRGKASGSRGWSDERRAKFDASIAARNAGK